MANTNTPFGLRPVKYRNGAPWNGSTNKYVLKKETDLTYALGIGDPVIRAGDADARGIPDVDEINVADGQRMTGVIVSMDPINGSSFDASSNQVPIGTATRAADIYLNVCDDPDVIFEVQDDGAAALTSANIGQNAVLIRTAVTNATTGISGMCLDTNSDAPDADASNMLRIVRLVDRPDNEIGAYAKWEVMISQHTEANNEVLGI